MKIGEVIRKYRKEKHLTQEEVAGYLGVSAPAVNKWENDVCFPDISLLAPIARLFGISTDTLLSYKEDLAELEMNQIIENCCRKMQNGDYDEAFQWAMKKIQEYPNCNTLILTLTQAIDGYRTVLAISEPGRYDEAIQNLYLRLLECGENAIVQKAAAALFHASLAEGAYEKAEEYLNRFPKQIYNAECLRALLYQKQEKIQEAYELYEKLIFTGYNDISWALNGIHSLAIWDNDIAKAEYMVEKQEKLARLFEMGKYMEVSPGLALAIHQKDKEKTLKLLEEIVGSFSDWGDFKKSELYAHMKFSECRNDSVMLMIKRGLESDAGLDFIRYDVRYKKLLEDFKIMSGKQE